MATGALVYLPYLECADDLGAPLSGGLVYSYVTGTQDASPLYTDSALTIEHNNPIQLDAAGRAVAYAADLAYKLIVKTSAGVTVRTVDPYRIAPPTAAEVTELDRLVILSI
jgi:hypothetical protein